MYHVQVINQRVSVRLVSVLEKHEWVRRSALNLAASKFGSGRMKRFMAANEFLPRLVTVAHSEGTFFMGSGSNTPGAPIDLVSQMLWVNGPMSFEAPLPRVVAALSGAASDRVAIVVGANSGYYAMLIAQCGAGRVIAYEPFPPARDRLIDNIKISGLATQITVSKNAVSSQQGKAALYIPDESKVGRFLEGSSSLDRTFKDDFSREIEVDVVRLDDSSVVAEVGLLFVDAEGMDVEVLRGSNRILAESRPFVAVEITNLEASSLESLIAETNYVAFELSDGGVRIQSAIEKPKFAATVNHSSTRSHYWSLVLSPVERVTKFQSLLENYHLTVDVNS